MNFPYLKFNKCSKQINIKVNSIISFSSRFISKVVDLMYSINPIIDT